MHDAPPNATETPRDPDRLLTVEQVADLLAMSPAWVRSRPDIPKIRLPGRGAKRGSVRYHRASVIQWVLTWEG